MIKNLLIVDDDYSFIKEVMNSEKADVFTLSFADSVKRAIDMLSCQNFDLVAANLRVPGGNSLKIKNSISEKSKVLFFSSMDSDYENLRNSGEICLHKYDLRDKIEVLYNYA